MRVTVTDQRDEPSLSIDLRDLHTLAAATLTAEQLPDDTEVAIALVDEPAMAALNQEHMGKSGATDVLSFPLEELTPGGGFGRAGDGPPLHLGDVLICPGIVARNSHLTQVPFADEMALMVVHGLLHLLGYDHVADRDAEQMEARERDLLAAHGRTRR